VGLVVVVCVVGRSERFSHGMVRSRKPLQMVPLHNTATTVLLLSTCTIQHGCVAFDSIPRPPTESIDDLSHRRTDERERTRANIRPLLTPRAIARGACGHSPYCRNITEAIAGYNPVWFSLSPLDGVVPLERA